MKQQRGRPNTLLTFYTALLFETMFAFWFLQNVALTFKKNGLFQSGRQKGGGRGRPQAKGCFTGCWHF